MFVVPSGPPTEISLQRESESSLLLQWSPPQKEQRKGNIIAYQVLPYINSIALRKAKIVCRFGLSECNRVNINKELFFFFGGGGGGGGGRSDRVPGGTP